MRIAVHLHPLSAKFQATVIGADTWVREDDPDETTWRETTAPTLDVTVVPEPTTLALLGVGGPAMLLRRRQA